MAKMLMGIDYGAKRVGIASTNETGEFALPRAVLHNGMDLVDRVVELARTWKVEAIVVGESKNLNGLYNEIQEMIELFVQELQRRGEKVVLHPEIYTSMEAARLQGETAMHDASAAALILKSYIDSQHN